MARSIITGSESVDERRKNLDLFNDRKNNHGEYVQIMIISGAGAEGVPAVSTTTYKPSVVAEGVGKLLPTAKPAANPAVVQAVIFDVLALKFPPKTKEPFVSVVIACQAFPSQINASSETVSNNI